MAATLARRCGVAALLAGAAVFGGWARPYVAAVKAAWTAQPGPPQPLSAPLWTAKTDQFRVLPGSAPAGVTLMVYLGDSITDWVNLDEFVEAPGLRVLNRGISGDTVSGIAARLVESVPAGTTVCFLMA